MKYYNTTWLYNLTGEISLNNSTLTHNIDDNHDSNSYNIKNHNDDNDNNLLFFFSERAR